MWKQRRFQICRRNHYKNSKIRVHIILFTKDRKRVQILRICTWPVIFVFLELSRKFFRILGALNVLNILSPIIKIKYSARLAFRLIWMWFWRFTPLCLFFPVFKIISSISLALKTMKKFVKLIMMAKTQ